ncbi:M20/M25/M40 family metallo-hydrolase, partial [Bacteroidota bacterium]
KTRKLFLTLATTILLMSGSLNAQNTNAALKSITGAELRDHIFFLASDYLKGRVATTPEYDMATKYVESQFAAAGLEPIVKNEDGSMSYFQGVPFARTKYSDELKWSITKAGVKKDLIHKNDFKILLASDINHDNLELAWVGFGIEDPDNKWNDFEGLDVKGKIMVCMSGAPMKKGKPVLPQEIHDKYIGPMGFQNKIGGLFTKGAAGLILIDMDGSTGMVFEQIPSQFATEKVVFKGNEGGGSGSFPSIYLVKPEFLNTIMGDSKNNPMKNPDKILNNYKTQILEDVSLTGETKIINEDIISSNNVIGMVKGTDPELQNEYIVVGGHLDHVASQQGEEICNGADDNASGSAGVIEIAEAIAMNPCKRPVLFVTWTAEEMGLIGSRYFINSNLIPKEQLKFNVNLDMIGRSSTKNEESRAHYVVTHKKYVYELEAFISDLNDGITDFPIIIDNDQDSPGGSDHQSFIGEGIPGFFFFSGIHRDLHRPTDDADKIDYSKAESLSRLGFLIVNKMANMDVVPSFEKK